MKTYSTTQAADVEAPGVAPLLAQSVTFSAEVDENDGIHNLRATLPSGESVPLGHFSKRRLQMATHGLRRAKDADEDAESSRETARLERQERRDRFIAAALPEAMREVSAGLIVMRPDEPPERAVARVARDVADAVLAADSTTNTEDK